MATRGAKNVLHYHLNSLPKALLELFPNIGLDRQTLKGLWREANRRKFFEDYAKQHGFDPLNPENWYTEPVEKIMAVRGAQGVVSHHNQNVKTALMDLFPTIGLQRSKFLSGMGSVRERKKFFLEFAKSHNFDPKDPNNWYSQTKAILDTKGSKSVLFHHGYSVPKALSDLFPKMRLNPKKFHT
eukprot:Phypoly_transcript_20577.p1 GENE.Phypoly_transcript_20577~~Phypoly_transcript_20577.p1  ORF type:complete len:206 (+),score=32.24 Phypoly_transcript_20577:67-618(+)